MLDKKTIKIILENYEEFERRVHDIAEKVNDPHNGNRFSYCEKFFLDSGDEIAATMCYPRNCGCCSDDHKTINFPNSFLFEEDWEEVAKEEGEKRLAERKAKEEAAKRQRAEEEEKDQREDYERLKKQFGEE